MHGTYLRDLDITLLINAPWAESFGRILTNETAICEQGWNPLNRNLILEEILLSTMTVLEREGEATSNIIIPSYPLRRAPESSAAPVMTHDATATNPHHLSIALLIAPHILMIPTTTTTIIPSTL